MDKKNVKKKNDLKNDKSSKINDSKKKYRLHILIIWILKQILSWDAII